MEEGEKISAQLEHSDTQLMQLQDEINNLRSINDSRGSNLANAGLSTSAHTPE